jgi:uncharacterized tellurite resistance protein B-like protein
MTSHSSLFFSRLAHGLRAFLASGRNDVPLDHAVAALLVHAATLRGPIHPARRTRIHDLVRAWTGLGSAAVASLVDSAAREDQRSADVHRFVRVINRQLGSRRRAAVLAMAAEVVFAASAGDDETGFLRLLGGLLGVSDHDRGVIQHNARAHASSNAAPRHSLSPQLQLKGASS